MTGIPHHVSFAPPVSTTSAAFIAASMGIMEMNDIPIVVRNAAVRFIWRTRMHVLSASEVRRPLTIARIMIASVDQGMPVIRKNAIVPRSPMLHPRRHHAVSLDARRQVWR